MKDSYKKLLEGNRKFSEDMKIEDPEYFKKSAMGQSPEYLWIGCSDSRVPANTVTGTESGEIFVHRNIANLVVHTDLNLLSVLEYAVNVLKVKHIIVCGHYGCGGVRASITNNYNGYVDNWLRNIKEVYLLNSSELDAIEDEDKRADRLTELNVVTQVRNLAKTSIVQKAWAERPLEIHGWVYGINNGLITELGTVYDEVKDLEPIFRFNFQ